MHKIVFLKEPPGDILVFLTGQDDIDTAVQLLSEETHISRNKHGNSSLHIEHITWPLPPPFFCVCIYIYSCLYLANFYVLKDLDFTVISHVDHSWSPH